MPETIDLPPPQMERDTPLMKALEARRTTRRWEKGDLSLQELSNILWAACGINRSGTRWAKSKRTAPSACNSQEVQVYIALPCGLFLYAEEAHKLIKVLSEDIRKHIGTQKMMKSAPVGLIYAADLGKMKAVLFKSEQDKKLTAFADTGFISQNVYLYCASAGLSTAVLGLVNREKLHRIMGLSEQELVVLTQVVGRFRGEEA